MSLKVSVVILPGSFHKLCSNIVFTKSSKLMYGLLNVLFYFQDLAAGKMYGEEAAAVYERATSSFLKNNMLLHFAYADFEEVESFCVIIQYRI